MLNRTENTTQGKLNQQILAALKDRQTEPAQTEVTTDVMLQSLQYVMCGTVNSIMSILGSLALQFNQRMPKNARITIMSPTFAKEVVATASGPSSRNSYAGFISAKNWNLVVRTTGTKIELFLVQTGIGGCRIKNYEQTPFSLEMHPVYRDGLVSWAYEDQVIQADGLGFPCRTAFQALVAVAMDAQVQSSQRPIAPPAAQRTSAPQTSAPQTSAPQTSAQQTSAPEVQPVPGLRASSIYDRQVIPPAVREAAKACDRHSTTMQLQKIDVLLSKLAMSTNVLDEAPASLKPVHALEKTTHRQHGHQPAPAHLPAFPALTAYSKTEEKMQMLKTSWTNHCEMDNMAAHYRTQAID